MTYAAINHFELEWSRGLKEYIYQLADEFLKSFSLSHVWLSKDYFDGTYYHLTNDLVWKEDQVVNNHYRDFANVFYTTLNARTPKPQFFM